MLRNNRPIFFQGCNQVISLTMIHYFILWVENAVLFVASKICVCFTFCPAKSPLKARHSGRTIRHNETFFQFYQSENN